MPIRNLEDFLKTVFEIGFWGLIFIVLVGVPVYYLLEQPFLVPYVYPLINLLMAVSMDPSTLFFKIIVYPGFTFVMIYLAFLALWERKLVARIQLRIGPQYAGRYEGILQSFADMFKAIFKETIVPAGADRFFFLAAPILFMVLTGTLITVVPVSPASLITDSPVALLLVFAIISLSPVMVLLAAWSSNNKFTLIGGLRALHQLVAYEIPMVISTLGVVIFANSMSLVRIVDAQRSLPFLLLQPVGAFVFFVTMLAELERIPFDIPEADSEIVMGWVTEYSGLNFLLLFAGAPYIELYALSGLFTDMYLAGWHGPSFLPADLWFHLKTFLVITLAFTLRAIYPRYRIDQLLRLGWGTLLFLALINIVLTILLLPIMFPQV